MSENVSPFAPSARQKRLENWTCSFEFVPIPCSRIATSLSGSNPAFEMSTEERRIEKGSASTTLSAVTVFVPELWAKVSVNVPVALRRTATSSDPVVIWPGERSGEPVRDLVVAADDVVLLVRGAEDAELALAASRRADRAG